MTFNGDGSIVWNPPPGSGLIESLPRDLSSVGTTLSTNLFARSLCQGSGSEPMDGSALAGRSRSRDERRLRPRTSDPHVEPVAGNVTRDDWGTDADPSGRRFPSCSRSCLVVHVGRGKLDSFRPTFRSVDCPSRSPRSCSSTSLAGG
jgi:hypothetical protein